MERKFIKSGISGLDSVLGGGFLENSIVTIGGPSGSGKSTFGLQFLYNGAYESGDVGVYICIDESRQDFMFHMGGYDWDIQKAESERKLVFLDYPIHEVDQILSQSSAVMELVASVGAKRIVVDSIMPIALFYHSDDERKKGFLKLIENIRKWGGTTLIISEDTNPEACWEIPASTYGIEKFTDGWIDLSLRFDEKKGERVRYLEVLKMKGVAHSMKPHPAQITSGGFSLLQEAVRGQPAPRTQPALAVQKKPEKEEEEILPIPEQMPRRRIMHPGDTGPDYPQSASAALQKQEQKSMKKPAPISALPKPPPVQVKPKNAKTEREIAAAKAALAAKLAAAKSRILKKK